MYEMYISRCRRKAMGGIAPDCFKLLYVSVNLSKAWEVHSIHTGRRTMPLYKVSSTWSHCCALPLPLSPQTLSSDVDSVKHYLAFVSVTHLLQYFPELNLILLSTELELVERKVMRPLKILTTRIVSLLYRNSKKVQEIIENKKNIW